MKILGRTQMIPGVTIEEAIHCIKELGFDGVEIGIVNREFQIRDEFFEEGFVQRIKKCLQENDLKYYSVGGHMDFTEREEILELLKKAIVITGELGAEVMIINGARRYEELPFEEQWSKQVECVKQLCAVAEENNIYLAVEFEPDFVVDSTASLMKLFEEVNSPMLKMNADIGHMFLQDEDPMATLDICGKYIVHAHVENMGRGVHDHLVPYEGDMDLKAYLQKLKSVGFDNTASLDLYKYDYIEVSPKSLAYLREIGA